MTIAEVSKYFDIKPDTLRYYEKIGLMDPVKKDESGRRDYGEDDFRRINFLKCMRMSGISIERLKLYIDLFHEGEHTIPERKEILLSQKKELEATIEELNNTLNYLNYKIDNYEQTLIKKEMEQRHKKQENKE